MRVRLGRLAPLIVLGGPLFILHYFGLLIPGLNELASLSGAGPVMAVAVPIFVIVVLCCISGLRTWSRKAWRRRPIDDPDEVNTDVTWTAKERRENHADMSESRKKRKLF